VPTPDSTPGDVDPTAQPVVNPDPEKYEVKTDEAGNEIIVDKETGEKVDVPTTAPARTGDPMIVMAAVAAVSAAGAFIIRKKRR
ncbi:MAG: hypothetical protein IKX91_01225, partial [Firmicutes bacterium]|nr:hypothetical protein [Bacillota bacterium]